MKEERETWMREGEEAWSQMSKCRERSKLSIHKENLKQRMIKEKIHKGKKKTKKR